MTDVETASQGQAGATSVEFDEFASLLTKEFKPKSDRAKEEVENAVRTLRSRR